MSSSRGPHALVPLNLARRLTCPHAHAATDVGARATTCAPPPPAHCTSVTTIFSLLLALTILPLYYRAAIAALLQTCKVACDEFTPFVEAVYAQLNKDPNASVRKEDKSFFSLADGVVQARSLDATRARTTRAHTHVHVHVHVHVASKGRIQI